MEALPATRLKELYGKFREISTWIEWHQDYLAVVQFFKGLSDEEARKILELPNRNSRAGALHGAILHCLLYMGLRKGELLDLKMGDLGEERGVEVLKVRGKGHRVRILPLSAMVKALSSTAFISVT